MKLNNKNEPHRELDGDREMDDVIRKKDSK